MSLIPQHRHDPGRRRFLGDGASMLAVGGLLAFAPALVLAREPWERLGVVRELIGDSEPRDSGVTLELPLVSEDGSAVPMTVSVDHPMDQDDHVQSIHLFGTGNPNPEIAVFRFTPRAGKAEVSTRVRLNESQTVIAVARTSRGEVLMASRDVRVTVSGCLARNDDAGAEGMRQPRVSVPGNLRANRPAEVRTLISHPMETGLREDDEGQLIPRRIIRAFRAELEGELVFEAELHQAVSANPYLRFHVLPQTGELRLSWIEETGETADVTETLDPA
jgi:sulfur-oxidizing protein SoxY